MPLSPPGFTALTNAQFLLTESAQVAQALLDGRSWAELRGAAREGHLFGPGKASSQLTVLSALKARFQGLDDADLLLLAQGTLEDRQVLVMALVTRQKPLVRAFIADVLVYKWQRLDRHVTDADARAFLTHQADQHPDVAAWSPATLQKTRGNLTRFLVDAGVLKERSKGHFETVPQHLSARAVAAAGRTDPPLLTLLEALK